MSTPQPTTSWRKLAEELAQASAGLVSVARDIGNHSWRADPLAKCALGKKADAVVEVLRRMREAGK